MKHTKGNWRVVADTIQNESGKIAEVCTRNEICKDTWQANAKLIAEAGTVATETGLTPRQLADQRSELLDALQRVTDFARTFLQTDSFGLIKKKDFEQRVKNRLGMIIELAEETIKKATT